MSTARLWSFGTTRRSRFVCACLSTALIAALVAALVAIGLPQAAQAEQEFLDPTVAFKVVAEAATAQSVALVYTIAPGYYLYREQFKFTADGATLGTPVMPAGTSKFDPTFNKTVEVYRNRLRIVVPVTQAVAVFTLMATDQGCADKGLCYPPQTRSIEVGLTGFGGDGSVRILPEPKRPPGSAGGVLGASSGKPEANFSTALPGIASSLVKPDRETAADESVAGSATSRRAPGAEPAAPAPTVVASSSTASKTSVTELNAQASSFAADDISIDTALRSGRFWSVVGAFFAAGVLLSLTPCVLPMLPILSSIIVGQGAKVSRGRGLALAASYSLGMALVYTAFGVAAGLAGEGLAATLQKPWVLALFAAGLVALAMSMFGLYELRLPSTFTGRVTSASQRLPAGRFAGVFAMGGISALIVSPCVAAPLAGALVFLSQTRDVWLGGTALFSLAAGMSVPMMLMGASAGTLLPRTGMWMDEIKRFFGLMLLGVALWTIQPVIAAPLALAMWGVLAISAAVMFGSSSGDAPTALTTSVARRAAAAVLAAIGLLQLVGAAAGGTDPLQPLARFSRGGVQGDRDLLAAQQAPVFTIVHSVADLDDRLQTAGRPVMLDFYADWCVSCKEMERYTFTDPLVRRKMASALLLKADVTANNDADRALLKRFNLFGPPGTIFFDPAGAEVRSARIAGFQNSQRFLQTLATAGL